MIAAGGISSVSFPRFERPARPETPPASAEETPARQSGAAAASALSEAEQAAVDALKARDREVRAHEEAHARVGGQYAGAPSYSYQTGPDGKQYAVGGEVPIDASPVPDDPEATIAKMEIVKAAALAPAEPSSTDSHVAAEADAKRQQALADLMAIRRAETEPTVDLRL